MDAADSCSSTETGIQWCRKAGMEFLEDVERNTMLRMLFQCQMLRLTFADTLSAQRWRRQG